MSVPRSPWQVIRLWEGKLFLDTLYGIQTEEQLKAMYRLKTGVMISGAAELGCVAADMPADTVSYTHLDVYKRQALEGMTGFQVNAVNVHVGGISFD